MATKIIATDGAKSIDLWLSQDPSIWNFFSGAPQSSRNILYAFVAAVYRAYNLKANTIGNMPFAIMKGKDEIDNSKNWQNKVGFLPNPSELFRLNVLSYIDTNTIYNLRTTDALKYKTKGLYFAVPTTFTPVTNVSTGQLEYIERVVGSKTERYTPDDKRLVRMWRLDHTTEVLPSPNTEAQAIQNAAEQVLYTDSWIKHYYKRGGIKPTLVAMKGMVSKEKQESEQNAWTEFLQGLGSYWGKVARVFNAETLDVKAFGDGVADLKDNKTYEQALANIAMGQGMPLSLLLANSANYATAKEEKSTWYENDIIPFCSWLAYEYNVQVFQPLGMRLEFRPETLDPQQEDETERATAFSTYGDTFTKYPTYGLWYGMANTLGLEISEDLQSAAEQYYAEKNKPAEVAPVEMPVADEEETSETEEPVVEKWLPTLDELEELRIWREVATRRLKKTESLDFEYQFHRGGLPDEIVSTIKSGLLTVKTTDDLNAVFDISKMVQSEMLFAPAIKEAKTDIMALAESLNRFADSMTHKQADK